MYNDNHIPGSPFKMSFCEVNQCEASGEGLMSAQVGVWNRFIVLTDHARPGALCMVIESGSGEKVNPVITRLLNTNPIGGVLSTTSAWKLFHFTSVGGGFLFQEAHSKSSATYL